MKSWYLLLFLLSGLTYASALTSSPQPCKSVTYKRIDPRRSPAICSASYKSVMRCERPVRISHNVAFSARLRAHSDHSLMSRRLFYPTVFLETMQTYYKELETLARKPPQMSIYATPEETDFIVNLWPKVRNGFCRHHPGARYIELSNREAVCPGNTPLNRVAHPDGRDFQGISEGGHGTGSAMLE